MPLNNELFWFLMKNRRDYQGHDAGKHGKLMGAVINNPHDYGIRGRIENCFKNIMIKDEHIDTHCDIFFKTSEDYYIVMARTGKTSSDYSYSEMMDIYRFFRKNFSIRPQMIVARGQNLKYRGSKKYIYFKRPISDLARVLREERER